MNGVQFKNLDSGFFFGMLQSHIACYSNKQQQSKLHPLPIVSHDQGAKQLEEVMKNHAQLRTGVISKLQGGPLPVIYVVISPISRAIP